MPGRAFLDTTVLIYAFAANDPRAETAEALLAAGGAVSVQVLNEFATVCRRKFSLGWDVVEERLEVLGALLDPPAPLTMTTHETARRLAREHGFSFRNALIVASAIETGANLLLTEELPNGQVVGALTIRNPFT